MEVPEVIALVGLLLVYSTAGLVLWFECGAVPDPNEKLTWRWRRVETQRIRTLRR